MIESILHSHINIAYIIIGGLIVVISFILFITREKKKRD